MREEYLQRIYVEGIRRAGRADGGGFSALRVIVP